MDRLGSGQILHPFDLGFETFTEILQKNERQIRINSIQIRMHKSCFQRESSGPEENISLDYFVESNFEYAQCGKWS